MNANQQNIAALLEKATMGTLAPSELDLLLQLMQEDNDISEDPAVVAQLAVFEVKDETEIAFWRNRLANIPTEITTAPEQAAPLPSYETIAAERSKVSKLGASWLRYAAAAVFFVALGSYIWFQINENKSLPSNSNELVTAIQPGMDGAILTLSDGSQLVLDSLKDGIIAEQNGAQVLLSDGSMRYQTLEGSKEQTAYNTMSTPKGRQYHFMLPDGTKVWLNAASSIRYPTAFTGNHRRVEVKGEVYLDVAKNPQKPFFVETNAMQIEVLGTEFNINNYENESFTQTTLVNGAVRVTTGTVNVTAGNAENLNAARKLQRDKASKHLLPGQQATILKSNNGNNADPIKIAPATNLQQVIAWKNGMFDFEKVDLFNLMRQLERWYNIEVIYEGKVENIFFRGKMYRNVELTEILSVLKKMGVVFELDGNKLVIKGMG